MSDVEFINDIDVAFVNAMGNDRQIVNAARASTKGMASLDYMETPEQTDKDRGLINYLMENNLGTPFEHGGVTFAVRAPIFVWREHHRHRIGWSYNEESGRYKVLEPTFYMPSIARVQTGKPGHYTITEMPDPAINVGMINAMQESARQAYETYLTMLDMGVAREVARMILPVNIMSTCYVTCNPRSLMHFMTLRTADNAMKEIRMLAAKYEAWFERSYPWTYAAWIANGKVAP